MFDAGQMTSHTCSRLIFLDWIDEMQYGVLNQYDVAVGSTPDQEDIAGSDVSAGLFDISWSRKESVMNIWDRYIANA